MGFAKTQHRENVLRDGPHDSLTGKIFVFEAFCIRSEPSPEANIAGLRQNVFVRELLVEQGTSRIQVWKKIVNLCDQEGDFGRF